MSKKSKRRKNALARAMDNSVIAASKLAGAVAKAASVGKGCSSTNGTNHQLSEAFNVALPAIPHKLLSVCGSSDASIRAALRKGWRPDVLLDVGAYVPQDMLDPTALLRFNTTAKATLPKELLTLNEAKPPVLIGIAWPDQSVPWLIKKAYWDRLASWLLAQTDIDTLAVACQGGHGRTGTVLAILAHKLGITAAQLDPVAFIRDNYCEYAVEAQEQIYYVNRMTDTVSKETENPYNGQHWANTLWPKEAVIAGHVLPGGHYTDLKPYGVKDTDDDQWG